MKNYNQITQEPKAQALKVLKALIVLIVLIALIVLIVLIVLIALKKKFSRLKKQPAESIPIIQITLIVTVRRSPSAVPAVITITPLYPSSSNVAGATADL